MGGKCQEICAQPPGSPLSLATDVTDATLRASGLWLGTRIGAGGTVTLTKSFFGRSPWFHGQQVRCLFLTTLFVDPKL